MASRGKRPHEAYPLRTVTRLTGLSPDIIRAWERRYGVVSPVRGPRGARLYGSDDIAHLRLLAALVAAGRAIGDIAALDRAALQELVQAAEKRAPRPRPATSVIDDLLGAVERFDATGLRRQLGDALLALGSSAFVYEVAAPLLEEVGERWSQGRLTVADEHLVSAALRDLVSSLILTRGMGVGPTVLLATPSGERHELGILLVALLALNAGVGVCHLGPDLPAKDILAGARRGKAAAVGLSVVDGTQCDAAAEEVRAVERGLPANVELWLGGRSVDDVVARVGSTRIVVHHDLHSVDAALVRLGTLIP